MKRFQVLVPTSLEEALAMLAGGGGEETLPLAGGTDILVQVKQGKRAPTRLVSLTGIPELAGIAVQSDEVHLGALTRIRDIERSVLLHGSVPLLPYAASLLGSWQVRDLATVGGNLANAAPSADMAPPLLVLEARVKAQGVTGVRGFPLEALFRGPGRTCLEPGEILTDISFRIPAGDWGAAYIKFSPRRAMDIAVVGVAALVRREGDIIREGRLALGAVAPTPIRVEEAEALMAGQAPRPEVLREAARLAAVACHPIDDVRASAEYRRCLVEVLTMRALSEAWRNSGGEGGEPA